MTVEIRALGVKCNLACEYCYQNPIRDAQETSRSYDLEAVKSVTLELGGPFTLFGGEPLLMPKEDLVHLLEWGFDQFGGSAIQTNGALVDNDHIEMFQKFNVRVGISLDGPGTLNSPRKSPNVPRTEEMTQRIERTLERLVSSGLDPSIIVTLHRHNASVEALPLLRDWFRYLDRIGVRAARLHLLEVDSAEVRATLALSAEENTDALLSLAALQGELRQLRFDVFADVEALLLANDDGTACVWRACDPYTTPAVQGVEGHGERSNCSRTNKLGVEFLKSDVAGYERYIGLYQTPYEFGGCKGCRFFLVCKGQCPGTAIDGDWRNRTEHCGVWLSVFQVVEARLLDQGYLPISSDPNLAYLEAEMIAAWTAGDNPTLAHVLNEMRKRVQVI